MFWSPQCRFAVAYARAPGGVSCSTDESAFGPSPEQPSQGLIAYRPD